jgi:hypothetical protein
MNNGNTVDKMKKISASALSVCFVATVLIIALIAQFSSLAWFSSNKRVSAEGMQVEVLYTDICETINYYRGTETALEIVGEDRYNRYYFSYDPAALAFKVGNATTPERDSFATPIPMLEYSDLSGSCQILIEIKLKNPGTYKIGISTETEEYLGNMLLEAIAAFETEGAEKIMIPPTGLPLSSVVHFAILDSAANDAAGVQDDTEKKMISLSDKEIAPIDETFVHFTETDQGITSSYATPFHDHADNKQTVEVGEDKLLYVYVDYYLAAVEDIIEKTLLYVEGALENDPTYNDIIIGLTNLMFSADFTFTIEEASES